MKLNIHPPTEHHPRHLVVDFVPNGDPVLMHVDPCYDWLESHDVELVMALKDGKTIELEVQP